MEVGGLYESPLLNVGWHKKKREGCLRASGPSAHLLYYCHRRKKITQIITVLDIMQLRKQKMIHSTFSQQALSFGNNITLHLKPHCLCARSEMSTVAAVASNIYMYSL